MIKRYILLERVGDTPLHGIGTVLSLGNAAIADTTLISCNELLPGLGIAYFLRDEHNNTFEVERVNLLEAGGVVLPSQVAPFAIEVVRK
jgi:hypothetical protein